jgi:DNA-binding IclR family transcriptional regulator
VLGRILLEDLSLAELRELYPEEHLEQHSPCTPRTVLDLFDLVQRDRQRGFVSGEGFFESTISTVAAPVRDHSGSIVAALGVTIPTTQIGHVNFEELLNQVRRSADELSRLLNYTPNQAHGRVTALMRD